MTSEELELYIDLDNKIKNRIVQIGHALKGVNGDIIRKFVPKFEEFCMYEYDKPDFIENTQQDEILHLGLDYDFCNGWLCDFNKSLLTMTDEQINKIVEYDRAEKEEKQRRQAEAAKERQERKKKQAEPVFQNIGIRVCKALIISTKEN